MSLPILGIDISKKKFDISLTFEGRCFDRIYNNDAKGFAKLNDWLHQSGFSQVHACMEATGAYGFALARFLHERGHIVSIINPSQIKAFAQSELIRTKTDKSDARLIARFGQSQKPPPWTPPPREITDLQALVRHLESLQDMRQEALNRQQSGIESNLVMQSLEKMVEQFDLEIKKIQELIKRHIDQNPTLKNQQDLLTTIPGIAETTARKLLSEIQNFKAYSSARQVAAYAGLNPKQHQSGSSIHKRSRLAKTGNSRLRKCLYFPAIVAKKHNPIIKAFCENLKSRGKSNMTIIAAAMRKLLHIAYGVLKSDKPFDPNWITVS